MGTMSTAQDFEARWAAAEPAPRGTGTVRGICVRVDEGVHQMPEHVEVTWRTASRAIAGRPAGATGMRR
jgi:hypothetical protein